MFLAFRICACLIFSKKGKDIFLFGVLPSKYSGSVAGLQFGCRKWKRRGLGRNFPFAPLFSFGEIRANECINTLYPDLGLFCNRIYHINTNEQVCLYKGLQRDYRTLENSAY